MATVASRFVAERVRPMAEKLRAIKAEILSIQTDWYGGLNVLIPNASDPVTEGREAEGVEDLTGIEVNNFMGQAFGLTSLNDEIVAKPCVRGLSAN